MSLIKITLPDGSIKEVPLGTTARQIATGISPRLEEASIAAKIDGQVVDLSTPLEKDVRLELLKKDSPEGLEVIRHSTAHLLANAVQELYPETQVTIGPVTEDGFYYDFARPTQFTPEDLPKIEKKMAEIASRKLEVTRTVHSKDEVIQQFTRLKEDFKVEIIKDLPGSSFSCYAQGDWMDLCRGPHVPNTARLGKFKLLSIAGAYWRGDEKNQMLQRIYGTAFGTQKELDDYLFRLEEAKRRDHRKLGPDMDLFTFLPIAPAMPFFLDKGALFYQLLTDYMRNRIRPMGYQEVICPQIMSFDLWRTSGHADNYMDNMYTISGGNEPLNMALKPMNCPGHCALFGAKKHSYRDLPLRIAEFSKLHRYERAGVTHGLLRTRTFSQDDAHIFCTEEQITSESTVLIKFVHEVYAKFGFNDVIVKLATRPEKYIGTIEMWDRAIATLERSLNEANQPFTIAEGEGAFYGPKIEFHIRDSLKRLWQCGTIQLDYGLPERFGLEYIDSDGKAKRPAMIHRAILGSVERFMGILVEHTAGHFPLWIAPLQAVIINVMDEQKEYCKELACALAGFGVRLESDFRNEKLGFRIREAQLKRVPLMLIIGAKELENRTLSVRKHTGETLADMTLDGFKQYFEQELNTGGKNH